MTGAPTLPVEPGQFRPVVHKHALAQRVLAVATTRIEGTWSAYIDAVPGVDHSAEAHAVLRHGDKLGHEIARKLFPEFEELPYAR